jgi:stearoyl-CoA desaturase (delta-9 desaturase)
VDLAWLTALIAGPVYFTWARWRCSWRRPPRVCLGHRWHALAPDPPRLRLNTVAGAAVRYLGTLVGMAGPYGMIRQHDIRDWAQRKPHCHAYLAHRSSFPATVGGSCTASCNRPAPELVIERRVARDRFYQFIDRTWMAQQLPGRRCSRWVGCRGCVGHRGARQRP